MSLEMLALTAGAVTLVVGSIVGVAVFRNIRRIDPGRALIVSTMRGEPRVAFEGSVLVMPFAHHAEYVDLTRKQLVITRRGKEGIHFNDGIRADITVTFGIRVNRTTEDVLTVARRIGAKRASEVETLEDLFSARFSEAIKIVLGGLPFEASIDHRDQIRDSLLEVIGRDLDGFIVDDASIDYLEQTPFDALDPHNILDAKGMKKIEALAIEAGGAPPVRVETWSSELARNGLLDVRVSVEISCDTVERESLRVSLRDATDVLAGRVTPSVLSAAGDGELRCDNGQATLRWTQTDITPEQLVAGARIVLAMRTEPSGYR